MLSSTSLTINGSKPAVPRVLGGETAAMQALRRTTGTAASLLRCALQPGAVGVWRQAVAPLQLQGVRWMVAKVNKGETTPLLEALTMVRTQAKAKFDEAYAPRPPCVYQPAGHRQPGFRGSRSLLRVGRGSWVRAAQRPRPRH